MVIEMKIHLITFHFFVSIVELEFQQISFLALPSHPLYTQIDSNAYFNPIFSNIGLFNRKTKNTVRFFVRKIRISIILYAFTIQTDFRNMSENTSFRLKNRAKSSQRGHFATFFLKKKNHCIC